MHLFSEHERRSALETAFLADAVSESTLEFSRKLLLGRKNRAVQRKNVAFSNCVGSPFVRGMGSNNRRDVGDDDVGDAFRCDTGSGGASDDVGAVVIDLQRDPGSRGVGSDTRRDVGDDDVGDAIRRDTGSGGASQDFVGAFQREAGGGDDGGDPDDDIRRPTGNDGPD